jgi:acyl phosphate:glycerol-3-phosphate acyltransferase
VGIETIAASLAVILIGYLIGSIPSGYVVLRLFKRQDLTQIGSGRTGGTNAMRAGGIWLGALTGIMDFLKGFVAIWISRWLIPGAIWPQVLAGAAAVAGHNWSIWLYLATRRLNAGAGTGPNIGAAAAFWPPLALVVIPVILFFIFIVGYASLASIAAAVTIVMILFLRAVYVGMPWQYGIYGLLTLLFVLWALRPNIKRLLEGTERRVGVFAKKKSQTELTQSSSS